MTSSDPSRAPHPQPLAGDHSKVNDLPLHILTEDDHKMQSPLPNMKHHNGSNHERTGSGTFDDLEFLHDFLEHESQIGFFESNCFKCNARNLCILCFVLALCGGGCYALYHWYHDYIFNHWHQLLQYGSIPLICIAFTYGHIALALEMTFWPTEFWPTPALQFQSGPFKGYGIGWQGIVPMKAVKMAQIAVDMMVPDVVRMEDVIAKIDPNRVAAIMEPALLEILQILIPRVAAKQAPIAWHLLPEAMKQKMIKVALADAHISVEHMISDLSENIEEMFDLEAFMCNAMRTDKELLSRIFLRCARKELIFIRNFGGVMGLIFGIVQMVANIYWSDNKYFHYLMLPISGFLLGWLTNWIALTLIFRPIEPIDIRPFPCCSQEKIRIQGLFLKRQREVSVEFASIVTKQILRADLILESMYRGPASDRLFEKITSHIQDACDRFGGFDQIKPVVEYALGTERFEQAKQEVIDGMVHCLDLKCAEEVVKVQRELEQYTDEAMDVERLLRTKMAQLPYAQFEGVLHPVFEQDEIKLIAIGAVLGLLVGLFQVFVIGN